MEIHAGVADKIYERDSPPRAASLSASKIRAGIVGAGLMGRWHAHALERAGGAVVAVADFDFEKAERLAASYRNAKAYSEVEKMLAAHKLDVLHVCSPTASHEAIAEIALKAGVHLLIEKPLAATADATAKLYDLAARNGALVCPVHQFAFQDGAARAEKLLPEIGKLVHLEANICSAGGAGLSAENLDSIAADILPHPLSVMRRFLKDDFSVAAEDWNVVHPASGELRIFGRAAETSLAIFISMNARPTNNSFHLRGTRGAIHLDFFHGYSFFEPGAAASKTRKILHPFDSAARQFAAATLNLARRAVRRETAYPGLRRLIREFYAAIESDSQPPITPAETVAVARVRDLLTARAGGGKR